MAPVDPVSQALVIGVWKYQHLADLPDNEDAQGVRKALESPECCAYPPERVKVLEQEQATRTGIIDALKALASGAKAEGSRTFVYFSGHGGQDADGSSYLLPFDARKGQYPTTAISAATLSECIDACKGEVTIVLDCCYAAGITDVGTPEAPAGSRSGVELMPFGDALRSDIQGPGRVILAACRPDRMAFGAMVAPYGLFTGHMLDGLRGKASTDGFDVTVYQLFDYVQRHVVSSSSDMQQPSFIAHIERDYRLTRYPHRIVPSVVFKHDVYISFDRKAPTRTWIDREVRPTLVVNGCTIWDHDDIAKLELPSNEEAIRKSKYVIVVLTAAYLRDEIRELNAIQAILQAIYTRSPRFIPVLRERCDVPFYIQAFVGLDLSEWNRMEHKASMDRLIRRLKKAPHEP